MDEESFKTLQLKAQYKIRFSLEDAALYGTTAVKSGFGILHYINRCPDTYSKQPNLDAEEIINNIKRQQP